MSLGTNSKCQGRGWRQNQNIDWSFRGQSEFQTFGETVYHEGIDGVDSVDIAEGEGRSGDKKKAKTTGKFGTGFLKTHLLSKVVDVKRIF